MKQIVLLLWSLFLIFDLRSQLQQIGTWREHLPYHQSVAVTASNERIFSATPYSVFSIELSDNNITRYSKMTGLSETGVSAIAYDAVSAKLVIAYENSNIDILKDELARNIDAIKRSTLTGDKKIYGIFLSGDKAYLCSGLGIIVIDMNRYEVKDTYIIGENGQQVKVNGLTADANFFYAATDEGLKQASVNTGNLADYRNWQLISGTAGLTTGAVQLAIALNTGSIVLLKNDSLFLKSATTWSFFYADGYRISDISRSGAQILLSENAASGARVVVLNANGSIANIVQHPSYIRQPSQAITAGNDIWVADSIAGLVKISGNSFSPYIPDSPGSIAEGEMFFSNTSLWVASGSVSSNWQGLKNKNGLYNFSNNSWKNFNATNLPALDSFPDLITVVAGPGDQSAWAGSFGGGLIQVIAGNSVTIFKQNSSLQPAPGSPGSYKVSGLALDVQNNLWVSNYGADQNIHVRKADGNWRSFAIPFVHPENAVSQIVIDDYDQKWIVSPKGNGLFCYNHGNSIDNTSDDKWRYFRSGKGNGNLPHNNVLCIAKDKNSFIWIGTSAGIGIIQCGQESFNNSCEAVLPVVRQGNFNGFLFSDEQVQAIAVDGANRKWVGTRNGVWLISEDGEKTIHHFTEENSFLLNNDVRKIAINGSTGEVFFATAKGICSFRGTATEGGASNNNVLVFPNPVPPGYDGSIAIRGLVNNAIVKITELNGRLVYQTRALGGQAIWNGKDYNGRKISTGVYLVLVSDETRKENLVTKIVFIK